MHRIVVLLLLLSGVSLAGAASTTPEVLERIKPLLADGHSDAALRILAGAIQQLADSSDAQHMLDQAHLREVSAALLAQSGRFAEAREQLEATIRLRSLASSEDDDRTLHAHANLAALDLADGRLRAARDRLEPLLAHPRVGSEMRARLLQSLAAAYRDAGDLPAAFPIIESLRRLASEDATLASETRCVLLLNCGQLALDLRLLDVAARDLDQATALLPASAPALAARIRVLRAELDVRNGARPASLPTAAELLQAGLPPGDGTRAALRWARLSLESGRPDAALTLLRTIEAQTADRAQWTSAFTAEWKLLESEAAWQAGDIATAETAAHSALELCRTREGGIGRMARIHRLLGFLACDRRDFAAARLHADAAATAERADLDILLAFGTEAQQVTLVSDLRPFNLPCTLGDAPLIARQAGRFKAAVVDALARDARAAARVRGGRQNAAWTRRSELRSALVRLDAEGDPASAIREPLRAELRELERNLNLAEPESAAFDYAALPRQISSDTALIEYVRYDHYLGNARFQPSYGAIVTTSAGFSWHAIGAADAVDEALTRVRQGAAGMLSTVDLEAALDDLGLKLWRPIASLLPDGLRRLVIAPDAALFLVPFAALPVSATERLIERYELISVSSARDVIRPATPPPESPHWVLVGDPAFRLGVPGGGAHDEITRDNSLVLAGALGAGFSGLPGTSAEIEAIDSAARVAVIRLEQEQATEAAVRSVLSAGPAILHFATHGFFLPEFDLHLRAPDSESSTRFRFASPLLRSGLALTGAQDTLDAWSRGIMPDDAHDGIFSAQEIAGLDLARTRLVVLSACDTGRGRVIAGEGVLGLRRAFQQAGVSALVITLWPIADQDTVGFMTDFYRALAAGRGASEAFSCIQRTHFRKHLAERGLPFAVNRAAPFVFCSFNEWSLGVSPPGKANLVQPPPCDQP